MKHFRNGFGLPVILIVLALVIIAGGLFWYINRGPSSSLYSSTSTTTPEETQSAGTTAGTSSGTKAGAVVGGLKKFKDDTIGFGFSYPANLIVVTEAPQVYRIGGPSIQLDIYSNGPSKILWGHVVANAVVKASGPSSQTITTSKVTVAGVTANQRLITDAQSGFKTIDEFFIVGQNSYELQFEYSNPQAVAIADTIIHSFYAQ